MRLPGWRVPARYGGALEASAKHMSYLDTNNESQARDTAGTAGWRQHPFLDFHALSSVFECVQFNPNSEHDNFDNFALLLLLRSAAVLGVGTPTSPLLFDRCNRRGLS